MALRIFLICFVCTFLAGCSLFFNRTTQKVHVSTGIEGARCVLETDKMKYQTLTPSIVHIERSPYDLYVSCSKAGYKTAYTQVKSKALIKPVWTGLDYVTPGMHTDTATRTVYSYPESISVPLKPVE